MIKYIKKNKLITILLFLTIITFIIGLLLPSILNTQITKEITNNLNTFIYSIKKEKINYLSYFLNNTKSNLLLTIIIWLLGISIIGIPIILLLYLSKIITIGLEISFLFKNILSYNIFFIIVYILPKLINLLLIFFLVYYSLAYSILLIRILFFHKQLDISKITLRYFKLFIMITLLIIITSSFEYILHLKILKNII